MLTAITDPETFERDGQQFTSQRFTHGTTRINLIRPVLTPEEYEKRRLAIEKAAIELVKSTMTHENEKELVTENSSQRQAPVGRVSMILAEKKTRQC